MSENAFLKRLENGGNLVVAEGYLFEFERRGYLKAGAFVPEVVIEHPDLVKNVTEEFVHSGSDVVLAFTYYGHRRKLQVIGREGDLEKMNRGALKIAREVAKATGTLMAGNICNTTLYQKDKPESIKECEAMFKEQIEWAVEEGADFIVAETFSELGEAALALECIKKYGKGLPAVVMLVPSTRDVTVEGVPLGEACRKLEEAGAAVVGLNCGRGPASILPLLKEVRQACQGPIACLPVPYRTCKKFPTMQSLIDPVSGKQAFPVDLPAQLCGRTEIKHFAQACKEIGVQYVGLCCGNSSHSLRVVAEVYGREPPASRYSPDMSQHFMYGNKPEFFQCHTKSLRNDYDGTS
ncbi:betaine--homocysteine S-methyltransferase 1 [Aplysia californica]|uniref:Betaine--homocysteine S-methyltransferase 1 n=1 Tax=Aplysia californica TaxID=6500 RepID=A0ABM0K4D5_APLCA|nr:betaine--homocysteine S-methyltransferase 1 [Aplysia californica]